MGGKKWEEWVGKGGEWVLHARPDAQVSIELCLSAILGFLSCVEQIHGIEGRRRTLWENESGELAGSQGGGCSRSVIYHL